MTPANRDEAPQPVPRRRGRRRRPRARPGARPAARRRLRRGRNHELSGSRASPRLPPASSPSSATWPPRRGLRVFLSVYQPRLSTTPLTDEARRQFASYVAAIVAAVPEIRDVIVGNEPNLNRFWMPQFDDDGGDAAAPAYFALLVALLRRGEGGRQRRARSGAARSRRAGSTGPAPAATPTRRRRSSAISARPTARAAASAPPLDGFAFHPYPENSSIPLDRADRPELDVDRPRGLRRSCGRCSTRPSGPGCRCSTARSASRRSSRPRRPRSTRARGRRAGRRDDPGRVLRGRDPRRLVPAERRGAPPLPLARRAEPRGLPVGRPLRRRLAEDEPRARPQGDQRRGRGLLARVRLRP